MIAATGTGVGKTFVACLLARDLRRRLGPNRVLAAKPIESGGRTDALALDEGACVTPTPHPLYCLSEPVSPHLAARRAGVAISSREVLSWLSENEAQLAISDNTLPHNVCVIESAGALLSPLAPGFRNVELLRQLEPHRVILIAPDALGVLHALDATLLALRTFAPEAAELTRVVVNAPSQPDASTGSNADEIERLGIASEVIRLERDATHVEALAAWVLG